MKFHWMIRTEDNTVQGLRKLSKELNDCGIYSLLLPYGANGNDYFYKLPLVIDPAQKLKYLVAVRPYAISPEYVGALFRTINEISPNRVILNIVSGNFDPDIEPVLKHYVGDVSQIDTMEKRVVYTGKWLEQFYEIMGDARPEIVLSGSSEKTLEIADKYSDYHMFILSRLPYVMEYGKINSERMLYAAPLVRDNASEIDSLLDGINTTFYHTVWSGNKKQVADKIMSFKEYGINNILFNHLEFDDKIELVYEMIKEINNGSI